MNNTPETDKAERMAYSQEYMVPTEFARKLERERDEWIKNAKAFSDLAWHLQKERDEAMEALMQIEDLFVDGTDIYADRENMGMIAREALEGTK